MLSGILVLFRAVPRLAKRQLRGAGAKVPTRGGLAWPAASRHLLNAAVALLMVLRSSVAMELLASASESLSAGADWET